MNLRRVAVYAIEVGGFVGLMTITRLSAGRSIDIRPYPIVTERRLELTKEYCRTHYGLDSSMLESPQVIVVHTTECATLKTAEATFKPDQLESGRRYLKRYGEVNVGVHFLVDRNGDVYSLLPLDVIGRHTIGLNYTAVGIENVGFVDRLTPQQLEADRALIVDLTHQRPTLRYLIGHFEYTDDTLPHYKLYKELVAVYHPTVKSDPGPLFMQHLREQLKKSTVVMEK